MLNPKFKNIYICFPGGKHKVLTMSYDDGREEDRRLVSIFNEHGIKGTFNLNSGIFSDPHRVPVEEYPELYRGHEIACHTYTHPTIERCPTELVARQILQDRYELEALSGAPVRGLAYPNGSYSKEIMALLPALGIKYSRVVETTGGFGMPENFLEWKGTCHHNGRLLELGEQFINMHKTQYLYMMYVWGHSFEFTTYGNWDVMENFCGMVENKDDIWYATNIEIVDYMEDAKRLRFTAACDKVFNPNAGSVWLEVDGGKAEIPGGALVSL